MVWIDATKINRVSSSSSSSNTLSPLCLILKKKLLWLTSYINTELQRTMQFLNENWTTTSKLWLTVVMNSLQKESTLHTDALSTD